MARKKSSKVALVETGIEPFVRPTKADLFVEAFIRHRFNATQAALEVFNLEGDEETRKATAGSVGYTYLRKDDVQTKLRERMARNDISVEYVLRRLKEIGEKTENDDVALRTLDRLAHFVGAPIKEASTDVSARRNSQLNLYLGLPNDQNKDGVTSRKGLVEAKEIT